MSKFPMMPLWVGDYLMDTQHLSDAEHGRYLLLLMALWIAPGQRLPNDDVWLSRKFQRGKDRVRSELRPLIAEFCTTDDDWITQKRLTREHVRSQAFSNKQSKIAKRRWNHSKNGDATAMPAQALPPSLSPSLSSFSVFPSENEDQRILSTEEERAPKNSARATSQGTRWDANAVVPHDWRNDARDKRADHGLPALDIDLVAETFANYWASKTGRDATKIDWHRTWINWVLQTKDQSHDRRKSAHETFRDAAIRSALRHRDDERDGS